MAVSYAPTKLRVPAGFQNLLEGLAREVLREQPPDIVSFAAQYFKNKLVLREEASKDDAKRGEQFENMMKGEDVDIDPNDPSVQAAATKIQASFRGHKAREEVKKHKEEEDAAIKIQATFRGHVTREQVKDIKVSQSNEKVQQSEKEAEVTADAPKDEQGGTGQAEVVDIDLNDPDVQGAALKIQSSFRGHKAREEVKAMKSSEGVGQNQVESAPGPQQDSEVQPEAQQTPAAAAAADNATPQEETQEESEVIDIDLEDPEVQKAASKIQASFRGKLSRSSKENVAKPTDEGQTEDKAPTETQEKSEEVPVQQSQAPAESVQQSEEPTAEEQNQETAEPSQEPQEQSQEPEKQTQEPEDPSQQPSEPSQEVVAQSEEPVEQQGPSEETNEQPQEQEQPSQEPEESKQEADEISQEPVEQSQEPQDVSSQEPAEPSQEQDAPGQEEPSQKQEAPSQEQETPSQEQEVPSQETTEQ